MGLGLAASALADRPTVKLTKADQAVAAAALLRKGDLGTGWEGGRIEAIPLSSPGCPGFDPKESDLVVSGHADARYTLAAAGVELDQDVQVLASAAAVKTDFARTAVPALAKCFGYQLDRMQTVVSSTVARIPFPPTGSVWAVYRAELTVRRGKETGRLVTDYVFFGEGRVEYELTVIAPLVERDELTRFETRLARILLERPRAVSA